jgi:hypothetical protein|tara:strand:- start:347 stop:1186 length:840 start_codon:yes stop_codon:yes gene_type:complete
MKKTPAFQFYPDKFLAGTNHLSADAFQAYTRMLCWIWLHGPNQWSMINSKKNWEFSTQKKGKKLEKIQKELLQREIPVLKKKLGFVISKGLRKEALKQRNRRDRARKGGEAAKEIRQNLGSAKTDDQALPKECSPSPSPSVSPPPDLFNDEFSLTDPPTKVLPGAGKDTDSPKEGNQQNVEKPEKIIFNFKSKRFENITQDHQSKWREAYPALDIVQELSKMESWASANPKNRKSNWERFIVNWMTKAQDRAGTGQKRSFQTSRDKMYEDLKNWKTEDD